MPFIPHTQPDVAEMLAAIGAERIEDLFDEVPASLRCGELAEMPAALSEMEITRLMRGRAERDAGALSFLGAGAYEHHIPSAVWQIAARGEYYTSYTPYQAEASQGTLQVIYEYQSMMCALTGLDVSNASLYDGASALAEAALMAVRANRTSRSRTVLVPRTVHPIYTRVAETVADGQHIRFEPVDYDPETGTLSREALAAWEGSDVTALVIPQPNYFGMLEEVDALTDWAGEQGALAIAVVNPLSLALLQPPGQWGRRGADIACGEGQALGIPLSSGGPYFGFMTTRRDYLRQLPGRLVGRTVDLDGRTGYTLTLQAREQHIRRSKATSNICTNQGLMVTAATVYMALLGSQGLAHAAAASHANTRRLVSLLSALPGVAERFAGPCFHEAVLAFDRPLGPVLEALAHEGVLGGVDLAGSHPELGPALLVCATETKTEADLQRYAGTLERVLASLPAEKSHD